MAQIPEERILDRRTYEQIIAEHFTPAVSLLEEVANYGTALTTKAFDRSDKKLADAVVLAVMLKQAISMLDAISILAAKCAVTASHLPLRALFESSLYLKWTLSGNTDFRAAAFYYWDVRRQLSWARAAKIGTSEEKKLKEDISDASWFNADLFINHQKEIDHTINILEAKLTAPELKDVHARYEHLRKCNRRIKDWYALDGVENLREMSKKVELQALYKVFYSHFSESSHGGSIGRHMAFRGKELLFEPIRNPVDWDQVVRNALNFGFQTYRNIIKKYCPEEEAVFNRIYVQEWRDRFLHIGKVTAKDGKYIFQFPIVVKP